MKSYKLQVLYYIIASYVFVCDHYIVLSESLKCKTSNDLVP